METFAFLAITFEPIGILTHSAHQNDRLTLGFVKDKHTGSKKMARNGSKTAIYFVIFIAKQSLLLCVWAEPAILGSTKTALKFKYEI